MIKTNLLFIKKRNLYSILFLLSISIHAQKIEKFYTLQWKECQANEALYYAVTEKKDSGYLRKNYLLKQRKLLYSLNCKDSICKIKNGEFISLYSNGKLQSQGNFVNNIAEGTWINYHYNGKMKDSMFFINGEKIGKRLSWYPNGFQRDSVYSTSDRSGAKVSWYDNGTVSSYGSFAKGQKKTRKWKYYHKNGKISALETYQDLKLIAVKYFDENGVLQNTPEIKDTSAIFPGGEKRWAKNILDNIMFYFPEGLKLINTHKISVVVNFTINEDGKTENIYLSTPFDDKIDGIVIKTIKNSPKWIPATSRNRNIKQDRSMPISFTDKKI